MGTTNADNRTRGSVLRLPDAESNALHRLRCEAHRGPVTLPPGILAHRPVIFNVNAHGTADIIPRLELLAAIGAVVRRASVLSTRFFGAQLRHRFWRKKGEAHRPRSRRPSRAAWGNSGEP